MKLIIAGTRTFDSDLDIVDAAMDLHKFGSMVREVVCGGASGIDAAGKAWAEYFTLPVKEFPADWETHGRAAGPIRNRQMAAYADALLLIWDGESRGSKNMRKEMTKLGKPIYEVVIRKQND